MTWDEVKELAPLYVIGALDEKAAHDLEVSLNSATSEQRRVVARWLDVAALLPQALPLQTPPDHIKERVVNRIAEEAQKTPIEIAVEESTLKEMAERAEKNVLPFVQTRRAESRTARWILIAATALLAFTSAYFFKQNAKLARERQGRLGHEGAAVGRLHFRSAGAAFRQGLSTLVRDGEGEDQRQSLQYRRAGAGCLEIDAASGGVVRPGRHRGDSRTQRRLASTHRQVLP